MVDKHMETSTPTHSQVVVFPPVIPLTGFLLGVLLNAIWSSALWIPDQLRAGARAVGVVLLCLGAAGFVWMIVGVVLREESFLERRFGVAYTDYKAQVSRWL